MLNDKIAFFDSNSNAEKVKAAVFLSIHYYMYSSDHGWACLYAWKFLATKWKDVRGKAQLTAARLAMVSKFLLFKSVESGRAGDIAPNNSQRAQQKCYKLPN